MSLTGKKIFTKLKEVYIDTGLPTGEEKPNVPSDPDYIPPVVDLENCTPDVDPSLQYPKIIVTIVNKSSQSIVLENFAIRPFAYTSEYYSSASLSLLPGASINAGEFNHLDNFTKIEGLVKALSKNQPLEIRMLYKEYGQSSFNLVISGIKNLQEQIILSGSTSVAGINEVSELRIEFWSTAPIVHTPPVVDAGADIEILNSQVSLTLTGSATDAQGILSVEWTQVSGPTVALLNTPNNIQTQVSNLIQGVYVFKLKATNIVNLSAEDTVKITKKAPSVNPNGIINVWVDEEMPTTSYQIDSLKIFKPNTEIEILEEPLNKDSGLFVKEVAKGSYRFEISIKGSNLVTAPRTLSIQYGTVFHSVSIQYEGIYVFDDVIVDEGFNGVLIQYSSLETITPTMPILFAKLTKGPITHFKENTLPNSLILETRQTHTVNFFDTPTENAAADFEGNLAINVTTVNMLNNDVSVNRVTFVVDKSDEEVVGTVIRRVVQNYSGSFEEDIVQDTMSDYELVPGQGYLIIP